MHLAGALDGDALGAVRLGNQREVGVVAELGLGVALVPEQLLPLPDHPEPAVVQEDDDHRELLGDRGRELLDDHLQPPVADDGRHLAVGAGGLGADGRRQAEAHGPEGAGGQELAGPLDVQEVHRPHLVLPDVGGDDGVVVDEGVELLHDLLGDDRRGEVVVVAGAALLPLGVHPPPLVAFDLLVPEGVQEGVQRLLGVGLDVDGLPVGLAELGGVDVDLDDLALLRRRGVRGVGAVGELGPHGDDEVGGAEGLLRAHPPVHAQGAHVVGVGAGDDADAHQRGDDGGGDGAGKFVNFLGSARSDGPSAGHDDGALALLDQLDRGGDPGEVLGGLLDAVVLVGERLVDLGVDLVDGEVDVDRPRPPGPGDLPRLVDRVREAVDVGDAEVVLGDRHHQRVGVDLLEGLRAEDLGADLAGEGDHGHRVRVGGGDPGQHVGGARPGGRQAHAGLPGSAGEAVGGVAGALLVPDQDMPDRRFPDLVVDGDDGPSRVPEHRLDAPVLQHFQQSPGAFHTNRDRIR